MKKLAIIALLLLGCSDPTAPAILRYVVTSDGVTWSVSIYSGLTLVKQCDIAVSDSVSTKRQAIIACVKEDQGEHHHHKGW